MNPNNKEGTMNETELKQISFRATTFNDVRNLVDKGVEEVLESDPYQIWLRNYLSSLEQRPFHLRFNGPPTTALEAASAMKMDLERDRVNFSFSFEASTSDGAIYSLGTFVLPHELVAFVSQGLQPPTTRLNKALARQVFDKFCTLREELKATQGAIGETLEVDNLTVTFSSSKAF
jgi:hypothetical protein